MALATHITIGSRAAFSPAVSLVHELEHAFSGAYDPVGKIVRLRISAPEIKTMEEKHVICSLETQLQSRSFESRAIQQTASPQSGFVEAPARAAAATSEKDDLKTIKGIGPAIERKLNHAGIQTFAALAGLSKRDLETILGSQVKRLQDENDLIAQAKKLARRR